MLERRNNSTIRALYRSGSPVPLPIFSQSENGLQEMVPLPSGYQTQLMVNTKERLLVATISKNTAPLMKVLAHQTGEMSSGHVSIFPQREEHVVKDFLTLSSPFSVYIPGNHSVSGIRVNPGAVIPFFDSLQNRWSSSLAENPVMVFA